jgi:hypothetical protein
MAFDANGPGGQKERMTLFASGTHQLFFIQKLSVRNIVKRHFFHLPISFQGS